MSRREIGFQKQREYHERVETAASGRKNVIVVTHEKEVGEYMPNESLPCATEKLFQMRIRKRKQKFLIKQFRTSWKARLYETRQLCGPRAKLADYFRTSEFCDDCS